MLVSVCSLVGFDRLRDSRVVSSFILSFDASGKNLRLLSPQPDTSLHCKTTNARLVHRVVCLFTS